MSRFLELEENLNELKLKIAGRANLIAVSKTFPASDIKICYDLEQRDFGENKVQELYDKAFELEKSCPEIRWHMIGHLQSNKLKTLLEIKNLVSIHSIDSSKLLNKLIQRFTDKKIKIFLQVNTSEEEEKFGFEDLNELIAAVQMLRNASHIELQGLMTIGKIRTDDFVKETKSCFRALQSVKKELEEACRCSGLELSMGMSSDYELALGEGTNWLRIGSTIFGKRV